MAQESVSGSCLCGEVQLRMRMPTLACVHCHCTMCQRNHGAAYVDIALHPGQIDVAFACLHGPIDRAPQLHIYFDDRADWVAVGDDLPRLGGKTCLEPIEPT